MTEKELETFSMSEAYDKGYNDGFADGANSAQLEVHSGMTIQELFDELRRERDWSKEVRVAVNGDYIPLDHIIPNLMNDDYIILGTEESK